MWRSLAVIRWNFCIQIMIFSQTLAISSPLIAFFTRCVCWPLVKIGARVGQSEWECSEQGSKNIEKIRFRLCLPIAPLYQTRLKMQRVLNLSPFFQGRKSALCWCWWRYNLCWPDQARGCNEGHFCRRRGNVSQFLVTQIHTHDYPFCNII